MKVKNRWLMLTLHAPKKPTFCLTIMMDLNIFNFGCNFKLSSPFTGWDNYWVPGTPQWSLLPVYLVSFGKSSFQSIAYSFYHNWTKFTRGDCGRAARGIFFEESLLQWSILAPFELLLGVKCTFIFDYVLDFLDIWLCVTVDPLNDSTLAIFFHSHCYVRLLLAQ